MKTIILLVVLSFSLSLSAKTLKVRSCDIVKFETVISNQEVKHYVVIKNSNTSAKMIQFASDKARFNCYCKWAGGRTPIINISIK